MVAQQQDLPAEIIAQIPPERRLSISGNLSMRAATQLVGILNELAKDPQDITCEINSAGGNFYAGLMLYEAFRECPSRVVGLVTSRAMSAAFMALQGCGLRLAKSDAILRIHNPEYYSQLPITPGMTADEYARISLEVYRANYPDLLEAQQKVARILHERNDKLNPQGITDTLREAKILTASEALELGFLDDLV